MGLSANRVTTQNVLESAYYSHYILKTIFSRTINLRKTSLEILGDKNHTFNYIAERLNCPREMVNTMAVKIPAIQTVRISKVHYLPLIMHTINILSYLLYW